MEKATGLQEKQFQLISRNGFGDPCNSYPHSMAWFQEHLYVGTTRSVLALLHNRFEELKSWEVFPVKCPKDIQELDLRSQIWRYNPVIREWQNILTAPFITASDGTKTSLFQGVRNMAVFQGRSDSAPALYALTWSPEKGPGSLLLRSLDGLKFDRMPMRTIGLKGKVSTFRPLTPFKEKVFTAPTGRTGAGNAAGEALVLVTEDPVNGVWRQANETNFGDPKNLSVFELTTFNGYLYAGTLNPRGFQVWKTDAEGSPPYLWNLVVTDGAGRGPFNETVGSMCEFKGALYVGSAIQNGGYDRKLGIGPAASELIRLYPDDSWELLVGDGRMTAQGLKMALSGFGPGFENFFTGYFWRMCVHEEWLYLGTFDSTVLMPYSPKEKWPEKGRRRVDKGRMEDLLNKEGGFDLWRTRDGIRWLPVTKKGFGNPYNYGVRTMVSTPYGLFVGTANPFGPEVAVKRSSGLVYEFNPKGGLEIWLGSRKSLSQVSDDSAVETKLLRKTELQKVAPQNQKERGAIDFCEKVIIEYYRGSGFRNFGFWRSDIREARKACENLIEELLSFLPEKKGRILDLATTSGATTRYLLKYYPQAGVTGVCLDKENRKEASERFPDINFVHKVFPKLSRNAFDTVISVERLSSCPLGREWLEEAVSSLKSGGHLLLAQVLTSESRSPWRRKAGRQYLPVTTKTDFLEFLQSLGLKEVRVEDATISSWQAFHKNLGTFLTGKLFANEIDREMADKITERLYGGYGQICAYVLASGRK